MAKPTFEPGELVKYGVEGYSPDQPYVKAHDVIYPSKGQAGEYAPLATNPYKGCGHKCVYCYVPLISKQPREEFDAGAVLKSEYLQRLIRDVVRYKAAGAVDQQVMLSFMTDPYHPGDCAVTSATLRILAEAGFGFCTLTKGGSKALEDINLFRPERDAFASTLTSLDESFQKKWERGAASPADRIATLRKFHERGIFTWVSLEPTINVEHSLALIRATHGFIDLYKIGKANYVKTPEPVDWRVYTESAIELCAKVGARHYIKKDLQGFLPPGYSNPLRVEQHH